MAASTPATSGSQTLDRGLRLLEELAAERSPLTIDDLAGRLDVHRSIAYRLLRTLEDHSLVARDAAGRVTLGPGLSVLAAGVSRDLQGAALPELTAAADELGMTCFVAVLHGSECFTLVSAEPRHAIAVAQHPGSRHAITRGAPGKAILAQLPATSWPEDAATVRDDVEAGRARGFATSHDEVIPGLSSVAVPLAVRGHRPASLAAVYVSSDRDPAMIAARLETAAAAVRAAVG